MIEMIARGRIQDPAVAQEFEHLIAQLRGFLSQSFDADGQLIVADPNLAVMPVGGITPYGGSSAPAGWLLCDGSQVSRTKYKPLYDVLGTTYGSGDGSTTFNVPDLRQRFPLGKAASGTGNTLGATGGAIDHTHTGPSHTHSISNENAHTHTFNNNFQTNSNASFTTVQSGTGVNVAPHPHAHTVLASDLTAQIQSAGFHSHGGVTGSAGTGTTGTANAPFAVVTYLIFAGV